ncbi:hydroxysqualene dehydroxylase HpnE [Ampullimonas aquatilis]|uniref:hydroxysqualene dehydroxylase HpnE n=1 Tax=Ampullimonas aquatilis TaxID=1341549 RepID=UPI003C72E6EC
MTIAIVGGGWAGLAAAVHLRQQLGKRNTATQAAQAIMVLEAAPVLGGRARRVEHDGQIIDNGQHILLGAYQSTLQLMQTVGIDISSVLQRLPVQLSYSDGFHFAAPTLAVPAPWHLLAGLLAIQGLSWAERLAMSKVLLISQLQGWRCADTLTVAQWLQQHGQPQRVTERIWAPLCISALNTPPTAASATVFLAVLRDSLGARRQDSDMLLPKVDLSRLLPNAAQAYLLEQGDVVQTGCAVRGLQQVGQQWQLQLQPGHHGLPPNATIAKPDTLVVDAVILATPPWETGRLLGQWQIKHPTITTLQALRYHAITTVYLRYEDVRALRSQALGNAHQDTRLTPAAKPFLALPDAPTRQHFGQFVFDRFAMSGQAADRGLFAVVISASDQFDLDRHSLPMQIHRQLCEALNWPTTPQPIWHEVIAEKRATFACTPQRALPSISLAQGLLLAGDYMVADYPATLESAVRSGQAAAEQLLAHLNTPH